eukprot:PhF_6_TR10969/c0_g1_i1/m.17701
MTVVRVLHAVVNHKAESGRPWSEFFKKPALPIRTNYVYRYFTNIVYFTRNYLNLFTGMVLLWSILYPLFFLCLLVALKLHNTSDSGMKTTLKVVQGVLFCVALVWYAVVPVVLFMGFALGCISLHAVVTPYTDEASGYFEEVIGPLVERPTTPVTSFERVGDVNHQWQPERIPCGGGGLTTKQPQSASGNTNTTTTTISSSSHVTTQLMPSSPPSSTYHHDHHNKSSVPSPPCAPIATVVNSFTFPSIASANSYDYLVAHDLSNDSF